MRTRAARPDDDAAIARVVGAGLRRGGPHDRGAARPARRGGPPGASLVAEQDGALVGHVQLSRSWVDARERLVEVLVLSPLSVLPEAQGRGVGTALVAAALERAAALDAPAVFLEGSPDYYGSRGFVRASELGFTRPSVRIPDVACQVALLPALPVVDGRCAGLLRPLLGDGRGRAA